MTSRGLDKRFCLTIQTVADAPSLRKIHGLPADLSDFEVAEYALQRLRANGEKGVLLSYLQRIEQIALVCCGATELRLTLLSEARAGGERDANVSALDMRFTGKKNNYSLTATGKLSQIYQDNNPKIGYAYSVGYSKISGNFRFDLTHKIIDNKFDPNDLGILFQDNSIENFVGVKYLDFKPKGILLNWDTY